MIEIRKILVPFDFSECSRAALDQATEIARWHGAEITALYVMPLWLPVLMEPVNVDTMRENARSELFGDLGGVARRAGKPGVTIRVVVQDGEPADVIVRAAEHLPADLVVMGTHGRHGLEKWLLGSVTEKVLRRASCPVLIQPAATASRPTPTVSVPFKNILCAVDFSDESLRALEHALSLAQEVDGRLTVLNVVDHWEDPTGRLNMADYLSELERDARERLDDAIPAEARLWCNPEPLVTNGKPYEQILKVAAERGIQLIVLGVRGRNALDLFLLGSTTNRVIQEAGCPVLAICPAPSAAEGSLAVAETRSLRSAHA